MKYDYDLIVLGGGAGGFVSAKLAAGLGKKVALIEKNKLGGECSNSGCVPSKAFIKAASVINEIDQMENFSLQFENKASIQCKNALNYVRKIIKQVEVHHLPEVLEESGIKVYFGEAQFINPHRIQIKDQVLSSRKFMITTGSSPFVPPIPGLAETPYLTNDNFFEQEYLPESIIVLGGGPIGLELAQSLNRLRVKTTVVEMLERILFREDKELVEVIRKKLTQEGLHLLTGTKATRVEKQGDHIRLTVQGEKEYTIDAQRLLVAVGRKANTSGLELEKAGVEYDRKGIKVNRYLQTTAKNIYACGDVIGPYQFSHMAEYQAVTATSNAFLPLRRKINYTHVLWVTFTEPELAHVGLTEQEARNLYPGQVKVFNYSYAQLDRPVTDFATEGMAKFVLNKKGYLLGAHIVGKNAGEIIHEAQILKTFKIKFSEIRKVIHAYPTYSDITRQSGKYVYIDQLLNHFLVRFIRQFKKS